MKKYLQFITLISFILLFGNKIQAQGIVIDHNNIDLTKIPDNWITAAKENLNIGYGHTSHGSQIITGMRALNSYFTDGKYDWSHTGGEGKLFLFEGTGYSNGYLDHDCGYPGWDDKTRTYLDDNPDCNVIMWSWCGQVNDVDLDEHYLNRMNQLETEYPDVKFVYMTGHLEGKGSDGSLFKANQKIRDYCNAHNKILFDFTDIEKYSPDADTNYQEYFCNDACDYRLPDGTRLNWAKNWLQNNPDTELAKIALACGGCAHSERLNCVKKGIAIWFLWARLAGWDGNGSSEEKPEIKLSLENISFGSVICENNKEDSFEITNSGNATLRIDSIVIEGAGASAFACVDTDFPKKISPQSKINCRIKFMPKEEITYNADLKIYSNADNSPATISISGQGSPKTFVSDYPFSNSSVSIKCSPNPINDILNIELNIKSENTGNFELFITDLLGRKIKTLNSSILSKNTYFFRIDFSDYDLGNYYIVCKSRTNILCYPLVHLRK